MRLIQLFLKWQVEDLDSNACIRVAADILGMLVGYFLKSKTPDGLLNTLAFVIFSIFGVYTLYQGLKMISVSVFVIPVWPVLIAATVIFVGLCVFLFIRREKKGMSSDKSVRK